MGGYHRSFLDAPHDRYDAYMIQGIVLQAGTRLAVHYVPLVVPLRLGEVCDGSGLAHMIRGRVESYVVVGDALLCAV